MSRVVQRALVGIGSNLGRRARTVRAALDALQSLAEGPVERSSLYLTQPVGMSPVSPPVVNAACVVPTSRAPRVLLDSLLQIETDFGRRREGSDETRGDRTLDLDLLLYGEEVIHTVDMQVPHPRMHTRAFVLVPACEVAADWVHPQKRCTLADLLRALDPATVAAVVDGRLPDTTLEDV